MKRILSGITPSGDGTLHIGNYLGAVKQFVELSNPSTSSGQAHECFLMFADLHALTTVQDRKTLKTNTENLIINEIALVGYDNPNVVYFRQSDVPLHAELQTILNNVTPLGLLKRAHAYKDKLQKDVMEDDINVGLFSYPMLMAADILLYKPDEVPVGKDQKQHIEITRDIAQKFNTNYKTNVFKLPEPHIPEEAAVVLGTDGKRKMSKSLGNIISIFADAETIKKQVNSTFTDPTRLHATDPGHIEGNMVFAYLDHFSEKREAICEIKEKYTQGKISDVEVKEILYETLMNYFAPARARYAELKNNPKKVKEILEKGTAKVSAVATQTMKEVREAVGLTNQYSFVSEKREAISDKQEITVDEFARVDERVGKVVEAKNVEKSERLIRLTINFGTEIGQRIIFTAVREFGYTPEFFQDKQFFFVVNLAPRKMPSYVETSAGKLQEYSQGMILAIDGIDPDNIGASKPIFLSAEGMPIGAKIH